MAGRGTTTLTFHGHPSGVQLVVLMPADPYHLQVRAGTVAEPDFRLNDAGVFSFDPGAPYALDTFNDLARPTGPI